LQPNTSTAARHLAHHEAAVAQQPGRDAAAQRIPALLARADDHLGLVLLQAAEELEHQLRRLLQVGRHRREVWPARGAQPNTDGRKGTVVARKQDKLGGEPGARQRVRQQRIRLVRAAVYDEDDLQPSLKLLIEIAQRVHQIRDGLGIAIDGHDERIH
jgi:hypothetical protein